jgi:hypothetical protein
MNYYPDVLFYNYCNCGIIKPAHYYICNICYLERKKPTTTICPCGLIKDISNDYCFYCHKDEFNEYRIIGRK